jgi:hypothetical protein
MTLYEVVYGPKLFLHQIHSKSLSTQHSTMLQSYLVPSGYN